MGKLCKNIKTGAVFWWSEYLKDDPDIILLTPEEEKEYLGIKKNKSKKEVNIDTLLGDEEEKNE